MLEFLQSFALWFAVIFAVVWISAVVASQSNNRKD